MKNCPKCGAAVSDNAKFCNKCRFNIREYEESQIQREKLCPVCNVKYPADSDFCEECGGALVSAPVSFDGGFGGASSFGGFGGFDGFGNSFAGEGGDVFGLGSSDDVALAPFTYESHADGTYTITGLKDKLALTLIVPKGVVAIADNAFEGCEAMNITLPEGLMKIGNASFKGLSDLVNINLPSSLISVGNEAFMDCVMLDTELPKSVRKVGKDAMKNTASDIKRQKEDEKKHKSEEKRIVENAYVAEKARVPEGEAKCNGGAELTFGTLKGRAIEWQVLKRSGDKALIISKYILTKKAYNDANEKITWESCSLRKWLNNEFLRSAFNSAEQAKIQNTSVSNPNNSEYNTKGGNATNDKIFLLSLDEVNSYFSATSDIICQMVGENKARWWWLRSVGGIQFLTSYVNKDGSVNTFGNSACLSTGGVRPAMWVKI